MTGELTLQLLTKVRDDLALLSESGLCLAINITPDIVGSPGAFHD